ncbi:hypothetical protein LTR27_000939 [Elasticomyces elasticus]|nr:hypothetical protein LTR27_000939 [Elasticomyces elasticus]
MGYEISMLLTATFKSAIRIDHNILQANVQSAVNFLKGLVIRFPLLRLPAEVWNIIYGLAMPAGETFTIASACHPAIIQPANTKISRRVRLEALLIFYAENEFDLHAFRYNFDHLLQYLTFVYCWDITETDCIHIILRQTTWEELTKDQSRL